MRESGPINERKWNTTYYSVHKTHAEYTAAAERERANSERTITPNICGKSEYSEREIRKRGVNQREGKNTLYTLSILLLQRERERERTETAAATSAVSGWYPIRFQICTVYSTWLCLD